MNRRSHTSIDIDHETFCIRIIPQLSEGVISPAEIEERSRKPSVISNYHISFSIRNANSESGDKQGNGESHCNFHYLHFFINFCFCLLLVPYRTRFQDGHYKLCKNRLQRYGVIVFRKLLCFWAWIQVMFHQLVTMRTAWQSPNPHPTLYYFYLAHAHLHCVLTLLLYWTLYSKFLNMGLMLEKISHSCLFLHSAQKRNKVWVAVIILHVFFFAIAIVATSVGYGVIDSWEWSPSWLFRSYASQARYAFFLNGNLSQVEDPPEWSELSNAEIVLTWFHIVMCGFAQIHMYLKPLLFGMCILTLWTAADSFQRLIKSLESQKRFKTEKGLGRKIVTFLFYEINDVSNVLNENWGMFCFFYIIDIIPYLATDLDLGMRGKDWYDAVRMFRSVLYFGFNIILSGETYSKIQWFRSWLLDRKNRDLFSGSTEEMRLILDELKTEPVGFGANGFYQLNYGFAAQVCTTIITFFIITLQYSDERKRSNYEIV